VYVSSVAVFHCLFKLLQLQSEWNVLLSVQVKVIVVDDNLNIIFHDGIKFDSDLPEFQ
jgi:hypothetical protein